MKAAKFEPTYISPLGGAFERYACKPLFSVKLETVVMNPWNSSFFFAGTCTYVFVCKPLLSINIGCQSENTRTDLSSEGLNGFLIVSRTYYFQVNNWYIFHFCISFLSAADHCAVSNLCKNGGICINGEYSFECTCLPGFYGKDCGGVVSKFACVAAHVS